MKKIYILCLSMVFTLFSETSWHMPSLDRKYSHTCFLHAHNSYSAREYGFIHAQQKWSVTHQLEHGVRGIDLDLYFYRDTIRLCHQSCDLTQAILRPLLLNGFAMEAKTALQEIRTFLEKNPQEIITIALENYVEDDSMLHGLFIEAGLASYLLTPHDWNPFAQNGWPTLQWMVDNNKRVVVLNQLSATDLTFDSHQQLSENNYHLVSLKNVYLWSIGLAGTSPFDGFFDIHAQERNTTGIRSLLNEFISGLKTPDDPSFKDRYPNFISGDNLHIGTVLDLVNEINMLAATLEKRVAMFDRH